MSFGTVYEKTDILTLVGHISKEFNLAGTPCPLEGIALFSHEACVYIKKELHALFQGMRLTIGI